MGYFEGMERADAEVAAKCDPKKGWKRAGSKCVRAKMGQEGGSVSTKQALAGIGATALGGAAIGLGTHALLSRIKGKEQSGGVTEKDVEKLREMRKKAEASEAKQPDTRRKRAKPSSYRGALEDEMKRTGGKVKVKSNGKMKEYDLSTSKGVDEFMTD